MTGESPARRGLLRTHRDFQLLWTAHAVSQAGTSVTLVALPLAAIVTLHASAGQVSLLAAAETAAFAILGLPAGAWVDRIRKRPLLIACDLGRAVALTSVPVAALLHALTLAHLVAVAAVLGTGTLLADVAAQSYLPALLRTDQLVEGNARLTAAQTVTEVAGPAVGGALVQRITAPLALLFDVLSYLSSAALLAAVRTREPRPAPGGGGLFTGMGAGVRYVLGDPVLRAITAATAVVNVTTGARMALTIVFLVRVVGIPPGGIGLLVSAGALGGVAGALATDRLARRFGTARLVVVSLAAAALAGLLIPVARAGWPLVPYLAGEFLFAAWSVVYNITQVSFRQAACPPELAGRMNATIRFVAWGTLPLGALAAGALGTALGLRPALWLIVGFACLAPVPLLRSPLRTLRDLPPVPQAIR